MCPPSRALSKVLDQPNERPTHIIKFIRDENKQRNVKHTNRQNLILTAK